MNASTLLEGLGRQLIDGRRLRPEKSPVHRGQRYGKLFVIGRIADNKYRQQLWRCVCDCTNIVDVRGVNLKSGKTKSCGCAKEAAFERNRTVRDLRGQSFGILTVLQFAGIDENHHAQWQCRCNCGRPATVRGDHLLRSEVVSCGCIRQSLCSALASSRGDQRDL
jgi:hypothetical protein